MADNRVQCPVENPDNIEAVDAEAFRAYPDGGNEFLLDFLSCPEGRGFAEVVARLRVHRDVLQTIHDRLTGSVVEPEAG